jgi:RHS repeat-associated protein
MKTAVRVCAGMLMWMFFGAVPGWGQMQPNLENGFKRYGSYDGSHLDTVNLQNGNLMLHAPLLPDYAQRGKIGLQDLLVFNSKSWQVLCQQAPNSTDTICGWVNGGTGVTLQRSVDMAILRTDEVYNSGTGVQAFTSKDYSLISPDGSTHQLAVLAVGPAPQFETASPTEMESVDTTGYHVSMSGADANGVPNIATVTDRHGNQYVAIFQPFGGGGGKCPAISTLPTNQLPGLSFGGVYIAPIRDDAPLGTLDCQQLQAAYKVTDSNGNFMNLADPTGATTGGKDTLGRALPLETGSLAPDSTGCPPSIIANYGPWMGNYSAPDGTLQKIKACYLAQTGQTAFHVSLPNPYGAPTPVAESGSLVSGGVVLLPPNTLPALSAVLLPDGRSWTIAYDGYGEITNVIMSTGGSLSYTWATISTVPGCSALWTNWSRALATRTLNDGQGNSYTWSYAWGTAVNGVMTNQVTDPLGNVTAHTFTALDRLCSFYETRTQFYQGPQAPANLVKQVDTTYYPVGAFSTASGDSVATNVVVKDITTTLYPSQKTSRIHREYDQGIGAGTLIFGNVKKQFEYDWGQGAPGPLLRETDTTYQWEVSAAYLTAHLLDLPASVIVYDGSHNKMAETGYVYDEPGYLTATSVATQHTTPPSAVRGNLTTVNRWLNTSNSFIASHTNWYDTGEVFQEIDSLGHTTSHSYDPFYAGAYGTSTCNALGQCVSGTYDFNTGMLASLTNANATTPAIGNSAGDAAHTGNYTYDFNFRLTTTQAPPDPANGSARAQTSFTFSAFNVLPLSVTRMKSITNALTDSATNFFDGLGRAYKGQHLLPEGNAAVDTTYDSAGRVATVTNPYVSTTDPTYGVTLTRYDALDRVTQVTKQDGSFSTVDYTAGNCTVATDEAGKQRRACNDALGRLVEVDEPGVVAGRQANNHASMQSDGNFVLYAPAGNALWSSGTSGTNGSWLALQDDGNLLLYGPRWLAGTYAAPSGAQVAYDACRISSQLTAPQTLASGACLDSPSGQYLLLMQTDGNLVLYDRVHSAVTWNTATYGHPGAYAAMQTDGNFVVYDVNNTALWSSNTSATNANVVQMSDDGRVIVWKALWSSGTQQAATAGVTAPPACSQGSGLGWGSQIPQGACLSSSNGRYELLMQTDGNLALLDLSSTPARILWSSNTPLGPLDPAVALITLYSYDALGNLLCVEQHGGVTGTGCGASPASDAASPWRVRRFTYDSLSRLLTATNPESGTISYVYDNDGNLLQKTSPAPNQIGAATQTVSYCYDALHRVTGKAYSASSCPLTAPVVSYGYDQGPNGIGHLTGLTDQAGAASYSYDILGRMATETRTIAGVGKTVSYDYNLDGSLKALHYPSGAVVTYTPDAAGRTVSAVDATNTASPISYVTGATYGPHNALTGFVSGNSASFTGIANSFRYNNRLQPVNMLAASPTQTVLSLGYDFHLGSGNNGNVYGITNNKDATRNQIFTYDPLNRLATAQNAGTDCNQAVLGGNKEYWGNTYNYDAWGNLLQKASLANTCAGEGLSVTVGADNRISTAGYAYDAAGNMTNDALGQSYTYDQENRITGAGGFSYTYDADGNRVEKANGSTGTLYWYMTPGIVAESDLTGTLKSEYVFFAGERVARRDLAAPAGVVYYFSDHLKTASVITDAAGKILNEADYYPWGGELQFVNGDSNHYKFTGKERDAETGLDYFGARYYSNGLGRFISSDWSSTPIPVPYADFRDPQSLNLYTYVRNIPTTNVDPDGHLQQDDEDKKAEQQQKEIDQAVNNFYEKHPWAKSWDELVEKVDNGLNGHGWKTDAQVANQDVQTRADWAKANPGIPYPELKIGIVEPVGLGSLSGATKAGETLTRFGKEVESAEKLGTQAAAAEAKIGVHGVSTTALPNPRTEGSSAARSAVEKVFNVHNTGKDPFHRTVELPKPVTQAIADLFNRLLGR